MNMNRSASANNVKARPSPLSTRSFVRYDGPSSPSSVRSRASTIASPATPRKSQEEEHKDVFSKSAQDDESVSPTLDRTSSLPERFDELPVELASLTDRFVEALSTKAYTEPPTIEHITELFQEFYLRAASSISIHVSALRLKLNRETSPGSSKGANRRQPSSKKSNDSLALPSSDTPQQMLTASEVTERRRQRRLLDYKKLLLEEAVERRACEKVYDKIWRHKSTLDEVKDEKLRSKTAALALVGIGLKDLGVEAGDKSDKTIEDLQEALAPARDGLMKMNEEHYPLGKLEHLTNAHKTIVDTLYSMHGSSSSADEILPTLIYTLISAPVEGINIISNLNFIQRFRASSKIDGEAAYCLTNLEAAIGFLEEVDLSTLRADEMPEGPKRMSSGQQSPIVEKNDPFPNLYIPGTASTATTPTTASGKSSITKDKPTKMLAASRPLPSPRHQRTLSDLFKPVQNANDAVRATAREGLDNISNTLDNSLKFFLGRFKEQTSDSSAAEPVAAPKTLDEARMLVNRPVTPELVEDPAVVSENSSVAGDPLTGDGVTESPDDAADKDKLKSIGDDKLLSLFGSRKSSTSRDRSVDRESLRSNSSNKKVVFAAESANKQPITISATPAGNALDAVRNFGGNLNPLGHLGNAFGGTFKGFGRPTLTTQISSFTEPKITKQDTEAATTKEVVGASSSAVEPEPKIAIFLDKPAAISAKIKSVSPPIQRFVEAEDVSELQIKDISVLLADYQRLARLLSELATQDIDSPDEEKP